MIYIVIPVFNRKHFTKACLNSLIEQTFKNYTIIVVDHGSVDGTGEMIINEFSSVILLTADSSQWWAGATNIGVKKAIGLSKKDDDLILTLNNDLEVYDNYLVEILNTYEKFKPCFVGSVSVNINEPQKVVYNGTRLNTKTAKYSSSEDLVQTLSSLASHYENIKSDTLSGRGTLIPKKAFVELGLYDERNFPHYMADEDFAVRGKKAGYNLIISVAAVVKSHVTETGLNFKQGNRSLKVFLNSLYSMRSANNLKYRYIWAKKHGEYPLVYFFLDAGRIFGSYFKKILKGH